LPNCGRGYNFPHKITCGKIPSLILAFLVIFVICACEFENVWMKEIMQERIITFDTNGGSHVPSQALFRGYPVKRPANPYKAGSVFLDWYWYKDDAAFLEPYDFSYIPKKDMTLYAKWNTSDTETPPEPPVGLKIPTADDFDISGIGTFTYDGTPKAVTVTAKSDITGMGIVTIKYSSGNSTVTAAPINAGIYTVTFDVAEGTNYKSASGLYAGTLRIDAIFNNLTELAAYLDDLPPDNTSDKPYSVKVDVTELVDSSGYLRDDIKKIIENAEKFVSLELTGTFSVIFCSAFESCLHLTSITIPYGVIGIWTSAFNGCTALTSIMTLYKLWIKLFKFNSCVFC
jgi:hypothetical protein